MMKTLEDFQEWLAFLELQTLTDELKEEILEHVENVIETTKENEKLKLNRERNSRTK